MKTQSPDTDPQIEAILIDAYRKMTPAQKLERVKQMNRAIQELQLVDIRRRFPAAGENEVRMRLAARWIPAPLMKKAFGWDPGEQGY
jgi:hypothetical protein